MFLLAFVVFCWSLLFFVGLLLVFKFFVVLCNLLLKVGVFLITSVRFI